jgi:nitroimidazol reductase NimA-like FMN-containing flavoprotein (pyridoxamine 5'-phosphate oxidase superfamily)
VRGLACYTAFVFIVLILGDCRELFSMSDSPTPTARTRVIREAERGVYDRKAAYGILDEGFICHVGFAIDNQPFVIPTSYGRVGDNLYIHGSAASRMLRSLDKGIAVCVTVTLVDGLVLARSIFNNSMNYRSVVVLGTAVAVNEPGEKLEALRLWCCVCLSLSSPPK